MNLLLLFISLFAVGAIIQGGSMFDKGKPITGCVWIVVCLLVIGFAAPIIGKDIDPDDVSSRGEEYVGDASQE
jgi:hypothetical protein